MKTAKTITAASTMPAFVPVIPRVLAVLRLTEWMCNNKDSLRVALKEDGTLSYSLYGGWGPSGISFSKDGLSLPLNGRRFASTEALVAELKVLLLPTYKEVSSVELLNQIF